MAYGVRELEDIKASVNAESQSSCESSNLSEDYVQNIVKTIMDKLNK
jgi:L-asparaginase/Glu-tRNA(Gln) amidotransferase subunit D